MIVFLYIYFRYFLIIFYGSSHCYRIDLIMIDFTYIRMKCTGWWCCLCGKKIRNISGYHRTHDRSTWYKYARTDCICSNIANIFLILGISALISPIILSRTTRFFDLPIVILVTILCLVLVSDVFLDGAVMNMIGRIDAIVLMSVAALYILYSLKHNNFVPDESEKVEEISSTGKAIMWIVAGVGVLFIGWKILVDGAVSIATLLGLSQSIIGLTIVAIGTSAPELVTSIIAARRWNSDIAVGNVVGSNIMNIAVILGISAFIAPLPFLAGSLVDIIVALSAPIMLLLLALFWTRNSLGKKEWLILISCYVLYVGYLISLEML